METLYIFPAGAISCELYRVEKETAKAVLLKRDEGKFAVWVPKAAIKTEKVSLPGVSVQLHRFANWFVPEKSWQRLSLGFTC
jgi:hypothetical protein